MDDFQVQNIALKTLKQRCEYLQQRLNAVEEENCRLKLEKAQDFNSKSSKESSNLEERIIILNKEKSQMAHKIQMITTENFNLWSQLSKILPGNSISSLSFSVSAAADNQMLKFSTFDGTSDDHNKESLEEISLKLINGIIMGKNEIEKQCSEVIDLQKENIGEQNLSFTSKQLDSTVALQNLKDYVQKLKDFKQALWKQKNELSNAITVLKNSQIISRQCVNFKGGNVPNYDCNSFCEENELNGSQSGSEFSILQDSRKHISGDEKFDGVEMTCPICGNNFNEPLTDFYKHVSNHFDDENDEFVDAVATLEVTSYKRVIRG